MISNQGEIIDKTFLAFIKMSFIRLSKLLDNKNMKIDAEYSVINNALNLNIKCMDYIHEKGFESFMRRYRYYFKKYSHPDSTGEDPLTQNIDMDFSDYSDIVVTTLAILKSLLMYENIGVKNLPYIFFKRIDVINKIIIKGDKE